MNHDDEILKQRLHELREDETTRVPSFDRVLNRPARTTTTMMPRLIAAGAVAAVVILALTWLPRPDEGLPEVSEAAIADLEAAEWAPASDALLVDAFTPSNEDLMLQINQLLKHP